MKSGIILIAVGIVLAVASIISNYFWSVAIPFGAGFVIAGGLYIYAKRA